MCVRHLGAQTLICPCAPAYMDETVVDRRSGAQAAMLVLPGDKIGERYIGPTSYRCY